MKTRLKRYGSLAPSTGKGRSWKSGWREVGTQRCFFRSRWEANYGRYLEFLRFNGNILAWEHEPKTFWFDGIKRGNVSYLPDFRVTNVGGLIEYHEVKGWMDSRSKTQIRRMAKYFPEVRLRIIDSVWFKKNGRLLKNLVPGWESSR
jgi:hypothetical protein